MTNSAVRAIVRVKRTLMRAIMDIRVNVFIITLPMIKKLQMIMGMLNKSKIIVVNQTKKNIISIIRNVSLFIQDTRVPVSFLVIDALEDNLLLGIN